MIQHIFANSQKRGGYRRPNPFPWIAQELLPKNLVNQALTAFASPLMKKLAR